MTAYVTYYRVSTEKQGKSGLGLEAQQEAVRRFLRSDDRAVASFTEVESGKNSDRPQLAAAMAACRRLGARLLIAKLDRLSRNVAFIANLMQSDVKFVACDLPDADAFRLHLEAVLAEEEARRISQRTKAALAAARVRGVVLGGFRGHVVTDVERAAGNAKKTVAAAARAAAIIPVVEEIKASGATTLRAVATALDARGIAAPRGGSWSSTQVMRLMQSSAAAA